MVEAVEREKMGFEWLQVENGETATETENILNRQHIHGRGPAHDVTALHVMSS